MKTAEKNSLLVNQIGGLLYQILADDDALYVVRLGSVRDPGAMERALPDAAAFEPGENARRIAREDIEMVHIRRDDSQTEISLSSPDGEDTWRMNIRLPDEAIQRFFGGLTLLCEEIPDEEGTQWPPEDFLDVALPGVENAPPIRAGELLLDLGLSALAALVATLWWLRPDGNLFWTTLLFFPACVVLLARCANTRDGRFSPSRLLWLLPGVALTLVNVRLNLPNPAQILLPAALIALLSALLYALLCGSARSGRKIAVVLVACLLTYAPGAALSINALNGERLRLSRVTPRIVRSDWIEAPLDGMLQQFYVRPDVCEKLSVNEPCELQLYRGMLGIEYWMVAPQERPDEV